MVRRAAPYAALPRSALEAVLDMLAGRYPTDEFAELRPRLVWDRVAGILTGRPGAQRLAVTSGGTIPDRGLFGVFLAGGETGRPGRRARRGDGLRVAGRRRVHPRLDELADRGHHPRPGARLARAGPAGTAAVLEGRRPRPAGRARPGARRVRPRARRADARSCPRAGAGRRASTPGRPTTCWPTCAEQREATGHVPDDRTIVVERFRDELGDWRVAIHSPFGAQVHAPWALAVAARLRERFGVDVQAMHSDDGIVLRLPDTESPTSRRPVGRRRRVRARRRSRRSSPPRSAGRRCSPPGSASARPARCCCPRRDPGRRTPLWQQRQRSAQLLSRRQRVRLVPDRAGDDARVPAGRLRRARRWSG